MNTTKSYGAGLTKLQYRTCRDAGFTAIELTTKGKRWYNANGVDFRYDHADDSALPKQLEYFAAEAIDNPIEDISYGEARLVIRSHEKTKGTDQFYIDGILAYESDNEKRNGRKRNTSAAQKGKPEPVNIGVNRMPLNNCGHVRTELDYEKSGIAPVKVELPGLAQVEVKFLTRETSPDRRRRNRLR